MEVSGDLTPVFGATLIQLDANRLAQIRNDEVLEAIDKLGALSAAFAHAPQQLTSVSKLLTSPDQHLYLYWEYNESRKTSKLLGFVRVGRKLLFLYDKHQHAFEGELLCILDAYVHQAHQRQGIGRRLFDFALQMENTRPGSVALDNPSVGLLGFMTKVYGVESPVWQNTNFVVFQQLFDQGIKGGDSNAPEGWRRESIPRHLGHVDEDPRLRYLVDAIPGHATLKKRPSNDMFGGDGAQIDETLSTRSARTRQRKQELLSNKPLW